MRYSLYRGEKLASSASLTPCPAKESTSLNPAWLQIPAARTLGSTRRAGGRDPHRSCGRGPNVRIPAPLQKKISIDVFFLCILTNQISMKISMKQSKSATRYLEKILHNNSAYDSSASEAEAGGDARASSS